MKIHALCAMAFAASLAQADQINSSTNVTPVIVVTGTKTEKTLEESPVPISVITQETLQEKGSTELDDILKDIPGIQLKAIHGQQGQEIIMQGMSADHVLILIDGVPVNQTDSSINLERLKLTNFERVEIVPGASSALYGSSAMGGVINLITQKNDERYFRTEVGSQRATNHASWLPNESHMSVQAGHHLGDGFSDHALSVTYYDGLASGSDTYSELTATGVRWTLNEKFQSGNFSAGLLWNGGLLERPYIQQQANNLIEKIKTENSHELSTNFKMTGSQSEHLLQLDADFYETIQDSVVTTDEQELVRLAQAYAARYSNQYSKEIGNHQLTLGAVASAQWLNQEKNELGEIESEIDDKHRESLEAFIQDDWFVLDSLEIVSGARGQWDSGFGLFFSPKVAVRWDAYEGATGDVYLRASSGLGYRVPDLKQRFYRFDHSHLGYVVLGNTNAEPETSFSSQVEVGGNVSVGFDLMSWSLNAFRQDVENLLILELDANDTNEGAGVDVYKNQNIGQAIIQGIDATITLPTNVFDHALTHTISAHYLDAYDHTANLPINYRPEFSAKLSQRIETPLFGGAVFHNQLNATGEQWTNALEEEKADGFITIDTNAQFKLAQAWTLNLGVLNLTNHYNDTTTDNVTPTLGRTFRVALRYQP